MSSPAESKVSAVVDHIQSLVAAGDIEVGDRLPSERMLSQQLAVSRAVVREAFAALELAGLIERRTGDGAFLTSTGQDAGRTGSLRVTTGLNLVDSLELRTDLEVAAVALACRRARESDLLKLRACFQAMREEAEEGDYQQYLMATMDLHVVLAECAHSESLAQLLVPLTENARRNQWILAERFTPGIAQARMEDHAEIVAAVVARDVARAVEAVMVHYDNAPLLGQAKIPPTA